MSEWIDGAPELVDGRYFPVGVLIDVRASDEVLGGISLIGHINGIGGVCDDCPCEIKPDDVIRHRFVWRDE